MAHGKRYRQQYGKVQRDRAYPPAEAIALVKETASAKFDETVELHMLLGVNVRHAEEQLRGTLALPHGLGKDVTIAVFAQGQQARDAEAAGADFVGGDDLAEKVEEGWTDFDVAIATPAHDGDGRQARPRARARRARCRTRRSAPSPTTSRRPSPTSKAGKVEYRTDRQAIVHMTIGKASFEADEAARQLHRGDRRDRPRQAVLGQGPVHPLGDADDDDGPRHPGRRRQGGRHSRAVKARRRAGATGRGAGGSRGRRSRGRGRARGSAEAQSAEETATA